MSSDVLARLAHTIAERRDADPQVSYVASLLAGPPERMLKKVGEEATELVLAASAGDRDALVHETADLWFHTMVVLASLGLGPDEVLAELERRFGRSGHEEKASRGTGG